ncbi:MAG: hypothetical protein A3B68_09790 [Candidatus Melainabacteria bacterium RIFCSPHIGHO2_02_FULL_34_12]|nr:MAG: hypothetical protein A3B68_09790 [Candidatus Melainabacteria bacterium RIFCSPHIGHO2_02_FULL_34_12]
MNEELSHSELERKVEASPFERLLDYDNYLKQKKILLTKKTLIYYRGTYVALTEKQISILKLIAKGFSNLKIAQKLAVRETAIKLLIYRLMKYIGDVLHEKTDRYYLVIIAQEMDLGI